MAKQQERLRLEQSPQYQVDLEAARDTLARAEQGAKRLDELHRRIAQLKVEQAQALEGMKNEREGNTTGSQTRVAGYGLRARGYEAAANRAGLEIEAAEQELAQLGNVEERRVAARQRLVELDSRIDRDADRMVGGASRKLDALVKLVFSNVSAAFAVLFWIAVGMIPDWMIWVAQGRMINQDICAKLREVESQVLEARLADIRNENRQRLADKLAKVDFRPSATPQISALKPAHGAFGQRQQGRAIDQEFRDAQ
jgi:DNA repair exonuclease SbcCD ATPase subunit